MPSASLTSIDPSTSANNFSNPLKRKLNPEPEKNEHTPKRIKLLERHTIEQARMLTEMSNSFASIKRSLQDIEDIRSKMLKFEMERNKREEDRHLQNMKIKKIQLDIKLKELQLLNTR